MSNRISTELGFAGFVLMALVATNAMATEFCDGFYAGYKEGWKRESGSIFEPSYPFCPSQPRKTVRDPDSDYEHGREIGYDQAKRKARQ